LTMARLEPEALARNFSRVDLVALAKEAIVARAPIADARGIDLGCTETADVPVRGDAATLATLMANLLDNALRFTPRGGRVDVGVASDAGRAAPTVIDTRPGLPGAPRHAERERVSR